MSEGQIRVECDCGKAARVPARFAGRQVKCGGCGESLRIPEPGAEDEGEDDYEEEDEGQDLRAKAPKKRTRTGRSKTGARGTGRAPVRKGKGTGSRVGARAGSRVGSKVGGKRSSGAGSGATRRRRSSEEDDEDPYAPSRAVLRDGPKGRSRGRGRGRGGVSKKRELSTEGHIFAIGLWHAIGGVLYALLGLVLVFSSGAMGRALGPLAGIAAGIGIVFILLGGGAVMIGIGLTKMKGWARITYAVVQGILILLQLPAMAQSGGNAGGSLIGICYTIAILSVLFGGSGSRVFSRGYAASIQGDHRSIPWTSSPFFWVPAVCTVLMVLGFFMLFAMASSM